MGDDALQDDAELCRPILATATFDRLYQRRGGLVRAFSRPGWLPVQPPAHHARSSGKMGCMRLGVRAPPWALDHDSNCFLVDRAVAYRETSTPLAVSYPQARQ